MPDTTVFLYSFLSTTRNTPPAVAAVDLTKTYNIRVICNEKGGDTFEFECEATKSFLELKQDVAGLTSIVPSEQQWSGFTYSTPQDQVILNQS